MLDTTIILFLLSVSTWPDTKQEGVYRVIHFKTSKGTMENPVIAYAQDSELARYDVAVLVFVLALAALILAGSAAFYCMMRGGNLEWTQYFWTFVKIACRFK